VAVKGSETARLDLSRVWADVRATLRVNGDTLSAIAGLFILMPGIVSGWILPNRALPVGQITAADIMAANTAYITAHWPIIVANAVTVAFGSLALLVLLLHRSRPTVATTLRLALAALPFYVLASLINTLVVAGGALLFLLPGVYLAARLVCIAPVAAVEGLHSPFAIILRSFHLTRGNGWRIILLFGVIIVVAIIVASAIGALVGVAAMMLLPPDIARLVTIIVGSLMEATLAVVVAVTSGVVYRQISGA
jgi:hypothetical protein